DGERMIKRLVAQELVLSFVPDAEQRLWRTVTRRKHQLTRDKIRFQNQLAALADCRLRATPEQLRDALGACTELNGVYRRMLKMALAELQLMEEQIEQLDREAANLLQEHQDAVQRVAEVPGFGVDSAVQMIAEVGPEAAAFESEKALSSWVGTC